MARVIVYLQESEREALCKLAERELRDPREQAAFLLREALIARGLVRAAQTRPAARRGRELRKTKAQRSKEEPRTEGEGRIPY